MMGTGSELTTSRFDSLSYSRGVVKFFRSPRPDNEDEVDSARSEARRDSADPPEPFLDPRHFERRWPFGSRPTLPNRYALGSERQDSASAWRSRSSAGAPTYSLGGGST